MGCAVSSGTDRGSNPRVFDVANIDDGGQERGAGKIEVTDTELVLYHPGREEIRWPLHSLRRYGYNDHLFSFESGRRCPTGHGTYAFRCASAELLFQQLQLSIVRAGEERARMTDTTPRREDEQHYAARDWSSGLVLRDRATVGSQDCSFADYINCPNFSASWRTYVNQNLTIRQRTRPTSASGVRPTSSRGSVQYADLDLPIFCDVTELEDYDEEAEVFQSPEVVSGDVLRPSYVNVPIQTGNTAILSRESRTSTNTNKAAVCACHSSVCSETVTYAQLDLDTPVTTVGQNPSEKTLSGPIKQDCSPRGKSEAYTTIDLQRTRALSTKMAENEDEGFRKTRHNSNIEMLNRN